MKNKELQELLKQWPDDMEVRLNVRASSDSVILPFHEERILDYAEDDHYDEDTDTFSKGEKERYLMVNPPIY